MSAWIVNGAKDDGAFANTLAEASGSALQSRPADRSRRARTVIQAIYKETDSGLGGGFEVHRNFTKIGKKDAEVRSVGDRNAA